jgi:hypothetical protein
MIRDLREVSSAQISGGERQIGVETRPETPRPDTRGGFQRFFSNASQRLATRQANIMAEQETERLWFWRLVRLEVERARRRDVGFTVLCIRNLDAPKLAELSHQIRPQLRGTDAAVAERDRVLILLSETSTEEALHVTRRFANHVTALPSDATWQEVSFPRDALTLGALIECLFSDDVGERLLLAG